VPGRVTETWVKALPAEARERENLLCEYFSSLLVAEAEQANGGGWVVSVTRPETLDVFVDPELERGLDWLGGIRPDEVGLRVWGDHGFQLSLEDSWTAYSWSRWLRDQRPSGTTRAVILHVDDHYDFESPHLAIGAADFRDLITGQPVVLAAPNTVESAIRSGAIGVAGFFAPFLRSFDELEIRHLRRAIPSKVAGWHALIPTELPDSLLSPEAHRPAMKLGPSGVGRESALRYFATTDPASWLSGLPDWPALVHMDLDYLNNRFNGDSDWKSAPDRHDPPAESVEQRLIEILDALHASPVTTQIQDFAVALSPGFFPAEFWSGTVDLLHARVPSLISAPQPERAS